MRDAASSRLVSRLSKNSRLTESQSTTILLIEAVDSLERAHPGFSSTVEEFLSPELDAAENALIGFLTYPKLREEVAKTAAFINEGFAGNYSMTNYILDSIALLSSVERFPTERSLARLTNTGHMILLRSNKASFVKKGQSARHLDSYFQPLAVASAVTGLDTKEQCDILVRDAPNFIAWAGEQEDMSLVLQTALKTGSISPEAIRSFITMQGEITTPLKTGLL